MTGTERFLSHRAKKGAMKRGEKFDHKRHDKEKHSSIKGIIASSADVTVNAISFATATTALFKLEKEKAAYEKLLARVNKLIDDVEAMLDALQIMLVECNEIIAKYASKRDEQVIEELKEKNIKFVVHADEGGF